MDDPGWPNWETWLRANNVDQLDPNKGPHFTSPNFTTQALLAGHGVALMAELVVESELAQGLWLSHSISRIPGIFLTGHWRLQSTVRTILYVVLELVNPRGHHATFARSKCGASFVQQPTTPRIRMSANENPLEPLVTVTGLDQNRPSGQGC
ncbi:MAG: hypothetical protein Ct9H300mP14_00780 [Gammaproteobacteria bacterium]|nr:MAG: hypothetical protein Ct9H300mP14_00780 [Gammaproteobacteria bacterium]